jgi:hypothetical protein
MNRQGLEQILRLRPAAQTSPPEFATNEDRAMNSHFANTFDLNSDIYEMGLIAAASPDLADALISALIAAGEDAHGSIQPARAPSGTGDSGIARTGVMPSA